jgi:hypothetical protein
MRTITVLCLLCSVSVVSAQSPTWEWALGAGGTANASGAKVAVDPQGNVYQTGYYSSPTIAFGDSTLVHALPPNTERIFLVKYNIQGELLWARQPEAYISGEGVAVATDADGNVIIGGYFQGDQIHFGDVGLYGSSVDNDLFVVKYDTDGNALWGLSAGGELGTAPEFVTDVCTDSNGNIFFTGYSSSEHLLIGGDDLTNIGPNQSFLAKMDPTGAMLWIVGCYGTCSHQSTTVTTDPAGNAYLGGWFFNSPLSYGGVATATASGYDGYLFKFASDGQVLWARNIGGANDEEVRDIRANGTGQFYAVGTTKSPLVHFEDVVVSNTGSYYCSFIARYDTTGAAQWAHVIQDTTMVWDVACDDAGNSYLTGSFQARTLDVGADTLVNDGNNNGYVLAHDAAGVPLWSAQINGSWVGMGGIATDGAGAVYVSGYYTNGPAQCGAFDLPQATPGSISNVLLAKLQAPEITTTVSEAHAPAAIAYPNPSSGLLYLSGLSAAAVPFTVLDAAGQVALTGTLRQGVVDVRALQSGIYILRLGGSGEGRRMSFVRE